VTACPYSARYLRPDTGKADKCNMCFNRVNAGFLPACVSNCVAHALYFGDLNDPNSEVNLLLKKHEVTVLKPDFGTRPNVYYVGLRETMSGLNYDQLVKNGPYIITP
jgi:tetrathionate reductase subunit B